ncbi:MAG TPA: peptide deformylase [Gammaproteobacteria bacterium]|jgi:peptide deformylase|nr:peptide deformylase [Gammaproteobacteria bacterium]
MALLDILHFPDPRLRIKAKPVPAVTAATRALIADMLETMYAAPGIGLAATQVGVDQRVIVVDVSDDSDEPMAFINPEILSSEGTEVMQEGCLSVPGVYEDVERAERIRVRALDRGGKAVEFDADGLLAVCIQHEIDHLEGKLFVDYLSDLKRQRIRKRIEKEERELKERRSSTAPSV